MDAAVKKDIQKILTAASMAPSGDNSQPWRFVVREPALVEFHATPEKDNALLNIDESGTLIALGAAIENAGLEAKALGYNPDIQQVNQGSHIATMVLHKGGVLTVSEQALHVAIPARHTNRKAYKKVPCTEDDRNVLLDSARDIQGVSLTLIEDASSMRTISRALTSMEEMALNNKSLHEFFFGSIFWSKERNDAGEHGLYIKTLELPPPAQFFFKFLRHWSVARTLAKVGFPAMVAETNAKQNASASAFGVLMLDRFDRAHYVAGGRALERIWLAATDRGLSLQIVTGILFLARALEHDTSSLFSPEERNRAQKAYAQIRETLHTSVAPFLIFRVGYAEAPSAVSFRKAPVIEGLDAFV